MKTHLAVLMVFLFIIFGCNTNSSSKENKNMTIYRQILKDDISLSGYWVFDNYSINGETVYSDSEYHVIQKHKGEVLFFNRDTLFIQPEGCYVQTDIVKTSTINHLHSENTVKLYRDMLSDNFNVQLSDSIILIVNHNQGSDEGCPNPFKEILFINDKLFIVEDQVVVSFVHSEKAPETDEEFNIVEFCKDEEACECEEGGSVTEGFFKRCKFYNMSSISELYEFVVQKNKLTDILKETIPAENISYSIENTEVDYIVKEADLIIKIISDGGMSELHFMKHNDTIIYELIQDVD